jgi:TonB family protein
VRFEPYLVESVCQLARLIRDKDDKHSVSMDVSGLLYGKAETGSRTVTALKAFSNKGFQGDMARAERWANAYQAALEEGREDPELSKLDLVGWFSFRKASGLLGSDVAFHNTYFQKPEDLAVILWREGPSQITTEVYAKSEQNNLTAEDYRWGSVFLSADIRNMQEPVDLAMRVKLKDDSYLRAYDDGLPPSQIEMLKRRAIAATEGLVGLLHKPKAEPVAAGSILGLAGDGRAFKETHGEGEPEAAPERQTFFNPYENQATPRSRGGLGTVPRKGPVGASSGVPAREWPGNRAAFAAAAGRSGESQLDVRASEATLGTSAFGLARELSEIGHTPRAGRPGPVDVGGVPMVMRKPQPTAKAFPWRWATVLFVISCCLVFTFLALDGFQGDGGRLGLVFQYLFPGTELNLRVRTEDDRLRLSWNLRNRAVATASDATLQIFDGAQHRDVHLDGRQVADGSVLYRPETNDVTFRLEVRGEQSTATGSVRVLDGLLGRRPELDVSMPRAVYTDPNPTAEPRLIRENTEADIAPPGPITIPPVSTGLPSASLPPPATTRKMERPAWQKSTADAQFQTPRDIPESPLGGSTIRGWDTGSKPRTLPRTVSRTPLPQSHTTASAATGAGFVPPRPVMQVTPNLRSIPNGIIQAVTQVEVQVDVDPNGHVSAARVLTPGLNDKISAAALMAAREWTFDPATNNGQHVNGAHTIVFEFRP